MAQRNGLAKRLKAGWRELRCARPRVDEVPVGERRVVKVVVVGHEVSVMKLIFIVMIAELAAGCSGSVRPSENSPPAAVVGAANNGALPVDASLEAVSASAPSAEAAVAMSACSVEPARGKIAGMALVSSGKEVGKYVPMYGTEPELATDRPVWVIQLKGEIFGRVGTLIDPTCVVVDGIPTMYITHGAIDNGQRWTPEPVANPPTMALPPLGP